MATTIYFDETDSQNEGWAYATEGGDSGSIDGAAADALTECMESGLLSDEQRAAIRHECEIYIDDDLCEIVLEGVGSLFPGESRGV